MWLFIISSYVYRRSNLEKKNKRYYCPSNNFYFGFERTRWRLFQKRVVRTKFDIYVFIFNLEYSIESTFVAHMDTVNTSSYLISKFTATLERILKIWNTYICSRKLTVLLYVRCLSAYTFWTQFGSMFSFSRVFVEIQISHDFREILLMLSSCSHLLCLKYDSLRKM
jgi:hypothetical protein